MPALTAGGTLSAWSPAMLLWLLAVLLLCCYAPSPHVAATAAAAAVIQRREQPVPAAVAPQPAAAGPGRTESKPAASRPRWQLWQQQQQQQYRITAHSTRNMAEVDKPLLETQHTTQQQQKLEEQQQRDGQQQQRQQQQEEATAGKSAEAEQQATATETAADQQLEKPGVQDTPAAADEQEQQAQPHRQLVPALDEQRPFRQQRKALAAAAPLPSDFKIPVPPPGQNVPAEPLVPLYSPDQLRLRLPVLKDVPLNGQIISLMEQMQQAQHLNQTLTQEQLLLAYPLLGRRGRLAIPERTEPQQYPDGFVAICAIVRNQARDLREWLEYHKFIGVQKVYIYDNNSTVPLSSVMSDFMQSGFVEYSYFTGFPRYRDLFRTSSQWWAYHDCITRFRHRHRWLAFIDADEFIVFHDKAGTNNIAEFMKQYDQYGGLAINWVVFGSSGYKTRPQGGVLVNYRQCLPLDQEQNQHVKVMANTAHLMTIGDDPHRVYYNDMNKFSTVNELGERVRGPKSRPSHTKIALYHYLTKSESEYMAKMRRGSAAGNYKAPEFFTAINDLATSSCTRAVPLGLKCCPSVQSELGLEGLQRMRAAIAADAAA